MFPPTSALGQFEGGATCTLLRLPQGIVSFPLTSAMLFGKEKKSKASLLGKEDKVKMEPKSEWLMSKEGAKDRKRISRIGRITWLPPAIFLLFILSWASAEEQVLEGSKVTHTN